MTADVDPRVFYKKATMLYEMGNVLMELRDRGTPPQVLKPQIEQVMELIDGFKIDLAKAQFKPDTEDHPILRAIEDVGELCYDLLMEIDG